MLPTSQGCLAYQSLAAFSVQRWGCAKPVLRNSDVKINKGLILHDDSVPADGWHGKVLDWKVPFGRPAIHGQIRVCQASPHNQKVERKR